jgi:CHASE2 domain-containing sensor protein
MSVPVFLFLIFGCFAGLGAFLAHFRYWKIYWALMAGIIALFGVSVAMTWNPSTDDPIPAILFLVIGVYGSLVGSVGMLAGLVGIKAIKTRTDNP